MADRPLNLLLVDSDSIFRLGLQAALQSRDDVAEVVIQPDLAIALEQLLPVSNAARSGFRPPALPDLLLLRLDSLMRDRGQNQLERSLRQFRQTLPEIPVMGLDYDHPPQLALWAQRLNLNGYWARGQSMPELAAALRQVQRGQRVWTLSARSQTLDWIAGGVARGGDRAPLGSALGQPRTGLWQRTVDSGIRQVETRLQQLERQRQDRRTPVWDQIWLAGSQRELRATRWLLNRFGGRPGAIVLPEQEANQESRQESNRRRWEMANSTSVPLRPNGGPDQGPERDPEFSKDFGGEPRSGLGRAAGQGEAIATQAGLAASPPVTLTPRSALGSRQLQNLLLDRIAQRIPPALINHTDEPLEIDILNPAKRQELFAIVLRRFGELLLDLRLSNPDAAFLVEKRSELLLDLWQASLSDFLGRYSSLNLAGEMVELLPVLLREQPQVERFILDPIAGVEIVFNTLLFEQPVPLDGVQYRPNSPEALERLTGLTENLLISVANGVVQPLLNNVAEVEAIRQSFYDKRLLSTREIEKFRNNLSWKYRVAHLFREAQDIYESREWLLRFSDRGLEKLSIYAPRRQELEALTPLQQSVTLMLETRDAIAPRLQFFAGWFGNGVVYVLTNIVGRGIGLIGRGIVQGVGSSIQDVRNFSKNNSGKKP